MDYPTEMKVEEIVANYWSPIDYEVLNRKGKFTEWFYWRTLCYIEFILDHDRVRWN